MFAQVSTGAGIFALIFIAGFGLMFTGLSLGAYLKVRRLKLLETAVQSGALDPATMRRILERAAGRRMPWLYSTGWIGVFVGLAMMASDAPASWSFPGGLSWWTTSLIVFGASLGIVTLPFAVRELRSRDTAVTDARSR